MNIASKKFGKLTTWGKEKMGVDSKSGASEDFKALEQEMNLRHDGLDKMHSSMTTYIKHLNKRSEGDAREKATAIANLGSSMNRHGEAFEDGNKFGECLVGFGAANERIARFQDTYASNATNSWLEALERSLAQMKDYQNAKKKLDSRRSAYDSSLAKIQKAKKDDFKAEEELRGQKAKYEESTEDVYRRMQDIIEAEQENSNDLYAFLEAELSYHDRCREVLAQLKRGWPILVETTTTRLPRSRTNTLSKVPTNDPISEDELAPPILPFRISRSASGSSSPMASSPLRELPGFDFSGRNTIGSRSNTSDTLPARVPGRAGMVDAASLRGAAPLRPMKNRTNSTADAFDDHQGDEDFTTFGTSSNSVTRSSSPATSQQSNTSRTASFSGLEGQPQTMAKKAPPPPPPRGSKPPPPPPPMKRSALSSSSVPYA